MQKKAIILFSGGLDSTTCLAIAKSQGFLVYTLSFFYHQKHAYELELARATAAVYQVAEHKIVNLDMGENSALINLQQPVKDFKETEIVPATYVPARNTIFLSFALGWAESLGANDIFIGANAIDYSGYPDCRPDYLAAFEHMANLATKAGREGQRLHIHAPLLTMKKHEIIRYGLNLGVDYSSTISCYRVNSSGESCGACDSCYYRKKGFAEAGVIDPVLYVVDEAI